MSDVCSTLLDLLERQSAGDDSALVEIAEISAQVRRGHVDRDSSLAPAQLRGIELLLQEWSGMFSFRPGRREGLPPLVSLLKAIGRNRQIKPMEIYGRQEWKEIVGLRGPVETVLVSECAQCRRRYPRMGMSGFLDLVALLCGTCGAVMFKSSYEDKREALCPCGGVAKQGCPSCGSEQARVVEEMSPYRYFAEHVFYREEAS